MYQLLLLWLLTFFILQVWSCYYLFSSSLCLFWKSTILFPFTSCSSFSPNAHDQKYVSLSYKNKMSIVYCDKSSHFSEAPFPPWGTKGLIYYIHSSPSHNPHFYFYHNSLLQFHPPLDLADIIYHFLIFSPCLLFFAKILMGPLCSRFPVILSLFIWSLLCRVDVLPFITISFILHLPLFHGLCSDSFSTCLDSCLSIEYFVQILYDRIWGTYSLTLNIHKVSPLQVNDILARGVSLGHRLCLSCL